VKAFFPAPHQAQPVTICDRLAHKWALCRLLKPTASFPGITGNIQWFAAPRTHPFSFVSKCRSSICRLIAVARGSSNPRTKVA
jgi:hypothetical protein